MPPETQRLGYASGIMDQLRASHEQMSKEELLDLVCHLTKTYVLDQTIPFDLPMPERAEEMRRADPPDVPEGQDEAEAQDPPAQRFARLIQGLKRRTGLPQLEGFSIVEDKAVLVVDNQKVTFGERVTVEFLPRAGRPGAGAEDPRAAAAAAAPTPGAPPASPAPAPGAPASSARPAPAPGAPAARAEPPRPKKAASPPTQPAPTPDDDDDYDASVERFRRLDLD